ncbi:heterokaryon incompatibility protein-domain-containing protein, partial [Microdochium trichocladiopsis]
YVALSYVWGSAAKQNLTHSRTPYPGHQQTTTDIFVGASAVILDAVQVTTALGYRYLWVDRYCIDQSNAEDKLGQINQMDLIYSRSEVTIVAAAGVDEHTGLPGVGAPRQYRQLALSIGHITILSTPPHPHQAIKGSKWAESDQGTVCRSQTGQSAG